METKNQNIDSGKAFDWGRTSAGYVKYRDVYPKMLYERIVEGSLCAKGQKILDSGTSTGMLPWDMYAYEIDWVGTDISGNQIEQTKKPARELGQEAKYLVTTTRDVDYPDGTFDVITVCQCLQYSDRGRVMPELARILRPGGRLLLLYMARLPYEDDIAGESEKLVLEYSPSWSGAGETIHLVCVLPCVYETFESVYHEEYEIEVPLTRETWNGRMKSYRGAEVSLPPEEVEQQEREHRAMLERIAPEESMVKHYVITLELKRK